jgi:hypothetical protein
MLTRSNITDEKSICPRISLSRFDQVDNRIETMFIVVVVVVVIKDFFLPFSNDTKQVKYT